MKFDTTLRDYVRQKVREVGPCEVVVISTCNGQAGKIVEEQAVMIE